MAAAAAFVYVNQIGFVYALREVVGLGARADPRATPIFAALAGLMLHTESLPPRFWAGALLSFVGVALVALGSGGTLSGDLGGVLLGVLTAATWAGYSMLVVPLMRRYSATRISGTVLAVAWVPIALTAAPQLSDQEWDLGWEVWALFLFATLGPLVLTNELWFRSLDRIGPAAPRWRRISSPSWHPRSPSSCSRSRSGRWSWPAASSSRRASSRPVGEARLGAALE